MSKILQQNESGVKPFNPRKYVAYDALGLDPGDGLKEALWKLSDELETCETGTYDDGVTPRPCTCSICQVLQPMAMAYEERIARLEAEASEAAEEQGGVSDG